jgi:hypothetical protein
MSVARLALLDTARSRAASRSCKQKLNPRAAPTTMHMHMQYLEQTHDRRAGPRVVTVPRARVVLVQEIVGLL